MYAHEVESGVRRIDWPWSVSQVDAMFTQCLACRGFPLDMYGQRVAHGVIHAASKRRGAPFTPLPLFDNFVANLQKVRAREGLVPRVVKHKEECANQICDGIRDWAPLLRDNTKQEASLPEAHLGVHETSQ